MPQLIQVRLTTKVRHDVSFASPPSARGPKEIVKNAACPIVEVDSVLPADPVAPPAPRTNSTGKHVPGNVTKGGSYQLPNGGCWAAGRNRYPHAVQPTSANGPVSTVRRAFGDQDTATSLEAAVTRGLVSAAASVSYLQRPRRR